MSRSPAQLMHLSGNNGFLDFALVEPVLQHSSNGMQFSIEP